MRNACRITLTWWLLLSAPIPGKADQTFTNSLGMTFARVPAGDFNMGSHPAWPGRFDDETQHPVTISRNFFMSSTEITQPQFEKVMGRNPAQKKGPNLPVTNISWADASAFCKKLSKMEARTYRLPTEAEWEYACAVASHNAPSEMTRLDQVAWHADNSGGRVHPVGQKEPNTHGLYDMLGNAAEWCVDWYAENYGIKHAIDPTGPARGLVAWCAEDLTRTTRGPAAAPRG